MGSTLELMQSRFPHIYDVHNKSTTLYALLSVYADRYDTQNKILKRLHDMIGIDTTHDEDLEHRWGSLLGIHKKNFETYDEYRNRLLMVYLSLAGGTAQSIKYAIASSIGICGDDIDKYIHVYDAWDYLNNVNINAEYGCMICTVDALADNNIMHMTNEIMSAINTTKASGIQPYLLFSCGEDDNGRILCKDDNVDKLILLDGDNTCNIHGNDDNDMYGIVYYESASIYSDRIPEWDTLGTNSLILNQSFVTNILKETDKHDMEVIIDV